MRPVGNFHWLQSLLSVSVNERHGIQPVKYLCHCCPLRFSSRKGGGKESMWGSL